VDPSINRVIKYKPISGRLGLHEQFGFKLLADRNIENVENTYCMHCDKSFACRGSNTPVTYHLQNKYPLHSTVSTESPARKVSFI